LLITIPFAWRSCSTALFTGNAMAMSYNCTAEMSSAGDSNGL
jgi:hypothetical protein